MITALLASALLSTAQAPPPEAAEVNEVEPLVVIGRPDEAARALKACRARKCPPREDMLLSLQLTEESFLRGDYRLARDTLRDAIGRHHHRGDAHPVLLAGLHKANVTVNTHIGYGEDAARSARQVPDLLARKYGQDSPEAMWARLERADVLARTRSFASARRYYRELREDAAAAGHLPLVWSVEIREAYLPAQAGGVQTAKANLQRIIDQAQPHERLKALAARLKLISLHRQVGEHEEAGRLAADVAARAKPTGPEPTLLWAPPIEVEHGPVHVGVGQPPPVADPSDWIDVGYWIRPDGRVEEPQVLKGGSKSDRWQPAVLDAVSRRIYAPVKGDPAFGGRVYRVERIAYTALRLPPPIGSRIKTRSPYRQVYGLDITRAGKKRDPG
ncbi:MAG TPA: hypothetical protein VF699_03850 [Caulobacteraceae bacterium]|jgi:hypothetical protein